MSKHRTRNAPAKADCQICTRPITDHAVICTLCGDTIAGLLGDIPALLDDLAVTYMHAGRGDPIITRSSDHGLPWSEAASEALVALHRCLTDWTVAVQQRNGGRLPLASPVSQSRWLLNRIDWLRHHPNAVAAYDQLHSTTADITSVMDVKAERWYAGPCRAEYVADPDADDGSGENDACCLVELYVKPGAQTHTCHGCKSVHDIPLRREWLLKEAEDCLFHAELIGRALASLGQQVTPEAIRGYVFRGRLVSHGVDRNGRETYRVGDVIEIVQQIAEEKIRRDERRRAKEARREARQQRTMSA